LGSSRGFVELAAWVTAFPVSAAHQPVIVHEWGTFTSLQDESGKAISGINIDDEPVPPFVYQTAGITITAQYSRAEKSFGLPPYRDHALLSQGWYVGDPQVTMRLETPVLYIYPPTGHAPKDVPPLSVHVDFNGGILSQSYPFAEREDQHPLPLGPKGITGQMTTGLTWRGVQLGSNEKPVETDEKVWTTPRETNAPLLQVNAPIYDGNGNRHEGVEAEHFLFYRGIGHLDSPVYISNDSFHVWAKDKYSVSPNWLNRDSGKPTSIGDAALVSTYDAGWLVEIQPDGLCAFRSIGPFGLDGNVHPFTQFSSRFLPSDFSAAKLDQLKASMQAQLIKEGLYPDEASAMLRTWELSYFKSPGLRFFYIAPNAWVNKVLPLRITGASVKITRVMVGRIELISDAEKVGLARLATGPCPDLAAVKKAAQQALQNSSLPRDEIDAFYRGEKPLRDLGIPIPPLVQDYLDLGRFRDAMVLLEQKRHPTDALAKFIKENAIEQVAAAPAPTTTGVATVTSRYPP
jgi:hypothetical protein